MLLKTITIEASESTGYGVWNSDDNFLVGVIIKKPAEKDGELIDVTENVRDMIREENNAYRVDISLIEGVDVIRPAEFGKCEIHALIFKTDEEDESADLRTYEIQSVSVY